MLWQKLGRLYEPQAVHPKLATHAANPLAIRLHDDIFRVFFGGRDAENRTSVGFVDLDIGRRQVVYVHDQPVFQHGPEGSFYSHGVSVGNAYEVAGMSYVLFMGWNIPPGEHWRGDIGRLILGDDLSLSLESQTPFLSTNAEDPVSLSYPWVEGDENAGYRMWYGSTVNWDAGNGEMLHVINQAISRDGATWRRCGKAVPYQLGVAQAFSRPTVARATDGGYNMWFSYRSGSGEKYRIGYAASPDGTHWSLGLENAGIGVSDSGWDSEMIEYPFVFDHAGERYMLYNGNGHGRTGFGLAVQVR